MLSAAAAVASPTLAHRLDSDSLAFHAAMLRSRDEEVRAARQLEASAQALETAFAKRSFSRADTLAIMDRVLSEPALQRYTDYEGGAQAVMAVDTLLSALSSTGQIEPSKAQAIRADLNVAYQAVADPNTFRPADFRQALQRIAATIRSLG
jgi:hypothetical protein